MLTPEQIDAAYREVWSTVPHKYRLSAFAEEIAAEVRKDDEALIRQMLEALETCGDGDGYNGPYQYYETVPVEEAVAAARARLEKAP